MPFCANCGQQYDEGVKFCPGCGAKTEAPQAQQTYQAPPNQQTYQQSYQQPYQAPVQQAPENDKTMAIIGFIFPVLFFLPLVAGEKNAFGRFWANQALLILLAGIAMSIVSTILTAIWYVLGILASIASIGIGVLWIIGVISVCKGEMKPLPLIGGIAIIK